MEWIQIESTLPDHQKTIDFACALKISQTTAVGALVRWWLWALHNRDSGFITDADGPSIAHAMDIKRSGKVILKALLDHRLIDKAAGGYQIHDWDERVSMLLDKRAESRRKTAERVQKWRQARNADVTRYGNAECNECNAPTVPNSTVQVSDDDDDSLHTAGAREGLTRQEIVNAAARSSFGRALNPAETERICEVFELRHVPIVAVEVAMRLAAENGATAIPAYIAQIVDDWQDYPIRDAGDAQYLADLQRSASGFDPMLPAELGRKYLEQWKKNGRP